MRVRKNICLSQQQADKLKLLSEESGLSMSDLIRRAIDKYIERDVKKLRKNYER